MNQEDRNLIQQLQALNDIIQLLLATSLEAALQQIVCMLQSLIPYAQAEIVEYDFETQEIHVLASTTTEPPPLSYENRLPLSFSHQATCHDWRDVQYIPDLRTPRELSPSQRIFMANGMNAVAVAPLCAQGMLLGSFRIASPHPDAFSAAHLRCLQDVARLIALCLQYENAKKQQKKYTLNLEALVDLRTTEMQQLIGKLAEANQLKNEFMAAMSHELRTPLNAIMGKVETLQEEWYGPLTPKQYQAAQVIFDNSQKLLALINNLLDVSHIESDRLSLHIMEVDVITACQEILAWVQRLARAKQIRVSTRLPTAPLTMVADEDRFKQILFNLLDNAVKFTPKGGEVGLEVQPDITGQFIHFVVWDTGIGISPDKIDFIFMLFTQVDGRLAREYEGTGLGLPLAYRLTQLHDGQLTVTSEVGKGSRFTVTLPVAFAAVETAV